MTEPTLAESLARLADQDAAILRAALGAIDALDVADADEAARFTAYLVQGAHGNTVRAAERRSARAESRALDAVRAATKVAPEIAESWGYSTQTPEVRAAIVAAHLRLSLRAAAFRDEL